MSVTYLIFSNNPLCREKAAEFIESQDSLAVLEAVRDRIHQGHRLLTHPLAGSVKPNENPYRSVVISQEVGELDFASLEIIESAIVTVRRFLRDRPIPDWPETILLDFQHIDSTHLESAMQSLK